MQDFNLTSADGYLQWIYQTCTELGFFQSSTHHPHVFSHKFPVQYFVDICADVFGATYSAEYIQTLVEQNIVRYGGYNIRAKRVIYITGSIDPWHVLGITETKIPESPAIFINGTSHCADMYPASEDDLPSLIEARKQVTEVLDGWFQY